ncbi:phage tail protein [Streptomyces sp. NPDC048636]|uniref:phage tail protein n=1 Tax=Streptomyces sp. NPDC048636 TaxID=3155762 RepID=UPI0034404E50
MQPKLPSALWTHPDQAWANAHKFAGPALAGRQPRSRPGEYPRLGLAMRFEVRVDELDLGGWSSCRGLQVQFLSKEVTEGGQYFHGHLLPDRVTFSTVTLERAMAPDQSDAVHRWLTEVASRWTGYEYGDTHEYPGQDITITLRDYRGTPVHTWLLRKAFPKEWSGPELSAQSNAVAMERLSFEHAGFLEQW